MFLNWKKEAINDLCLYLQRKEALDNIRYRIALLESQFISLKSISMDTPVMGGTSMQEEKLLSNISERERLQANLKIVEELVKLTEKGLNVLESRERKILEGFYFERLDNRVERLCERFHLEKTRLYEIKDGALRKFTVAMYGTVEI